MYFKLLIAELNTNAKRGFGAEGRTRTGTYFYG